MGYARELSDQILDMVEEAPMQRYEVLKRFAASVHDAVHECMNTLVATGAMEDDGVFLRAVR